MKRFIVLTGATIISAGALSASAAPTPELVLEYVQSYSDPVNFTSLGQLTALQMGQDADYVHEFAIRLKLNGAAAGEDFRQMYFNVVKSNTHLTEPGFGWVAANPTVDINGATPGGTFNAYSNNADGGPSNSDLEAILVQQTTPSVANSRQYGETPRPITGSPDSLGYPTLVGNFYMQWDTLADATLSLTGGNGSNWGYFTGNTAGNSTSFQTVAATFAVGSHTFAVVPEPASLGLAGIAGLGLLARRRRMA